MTKINQIAQAFAQGVKFAENMKLAMDAARDGEEDGHWVTIGEGEEARPVFIKGAKKKAAKTESKKAESKPAQQRTESKKAESKPAQQRTESKKAESKPAQQRTESKPASKKTETKKAAIKAAEDKYNLSIGDFLKSQKHAPGSFAKELMYRLPGKADAFEALCSNLSDDCKYLVKHALTRTNYFKLPPDEEQAFFSRTDNGVHFKSELFEAGKWLCGMTNHQVIMHEFGHAVDYFAGNLIHKYRLGFNQILLNALSTDTSRIISALRAKADKNYRSPAYSQQQADDRVAEYLKDIMYSRVQNSDIQAAVVASVSDMISAHTMNAIKDGGYHKTEYWQSKYTRAVEFIAHVFETSVDPELKKQFYALFPTATKTLEILISDAANTIRQDVSKGKIK